MAAEARDRSAPGTMWRFTKIVIALVVLLALAVLIVTRLTGMWG